MQKNEVIKILNNGGIGVIATDTLYGLVCSAFNKEAVEKIYKLKHRDTKKGLIILISDMTDLAKFGVDYNLKILNKYWPGPVSIILPVKEDKIPHLVKEAGSLAFRLPNNNDLLEILKQTGPLVAPSANLEGEEPAKNATEAKEYFGNKIDFYLEGGTLNNPPSKIIRIEGKQEIILR